MLKIRLQRTGRKHDPVFRVVVTDRRAGPRSGNAVEVVGNYDARKKDRAQINTERVVYWLEQGAQPSDTVRNTLIDLGVIKGDKVNVLPKKSPIVKEGDQASGDEGGEKGEDESSSTESEDADVPQEDKGKESAETEVEKGEDKKDEEEVSADESEKDAPVEADKSEEKEEKESGAKEESEESKKE